jgi:hypothetical protein
MERKVSFMDAADFREISLVHDGWVGRRGISANTVPLAEDCLHRRVDLIASQPKKP